MSRVLLLEDHRAFSESLPYLLDRDPDLRVVGRTDSAAECHRYLSSGEGFDVAVMDLYLPNSAGVELIHQLRESCPDVPVIVRTISMDPAEHARAKNAGADEVLSKAFGLDMLIAAIKRCGPGEERKDT